MPTAWRLVKQWYSREADTWVRIYEAVDGIRPQRGKTTYSEDEGAET